MCQNESSILPPVFFSEFSFPSARPVPVKFPSLLQSHSVFFPENTADKSVPVLHLPVFQGFLPKITCSAPVHPGSLFLPVCLSEGWYCLLPGKLSAAGFPPAPKTPSPPSVPPVGFPVSRQSPGQSALFPSAFPAAPGSGRLSLLFPSGNGLLSVSRHLADTV